MNHINTVGIVGSGEMGTGIAEAYLEHGFQVVVVEKEATVLASCQNRLAAAAASYAHNLECTNDFNRLAKAEFVVEAALEHEPTKLQLLTRLSNITSHQCILASNTSGLSIEKLASATKYPEHFVGLHHFSSPQGNKLVEVVRGPKTTTFCVEIACDLQKDIGKTPVKSRDTPGFIVNRFFAPWLNEAVKLLEEGMANEATIDAAAKHHFGIGVGPFELMNTAGLASALATLLCLAKSYGPSYAPAKRLRDMVESKSVWMVAGDVSREMFLPINRRLLGVVGTITKVMVQSDQTCTKEDCEVAAKVGLRWAKGPFELSATV
jgi:enoyl-CoA hydratase/3-hydroxyacyl-CoA dehydrogenase